MGATQIKKEVRIANISNFDIQYRDKTEKEDGKMIIEGYAAVFNKETLIGSEDWGFYESIDNRAFEGADMSDVPLKYNHGDTYPILARTRNKSLSLKVDDKGLFIHAELLDTQTNRDMYKSIKAGLIDKMSFAFTIKDEEISDVRTKTPHRKITKFDRIFDVSVVDVPAYEDTSIYARSREQVETWRGKVETVKSKLDYRTKALIKQYSNNK